LESQGHSAGVDPRHHRCECGRDAWAYVRLPTLPADYITIPTKALADLGVGIASDRHALQRGFLVG
jgi:hypothetical protein